MEINVRRKRKHQHELVKRRDREKTRSSWRRKRSTWRGEQSFEGGGTLPFGSAKENGKRLNLTSQPWRGNSVGKWRQGHGRAYKKKRKYTSILKQRLNSEKKKNTIDNYRWRFTKKRRRRMWMNDRMSGVCCVKWWMKEKVSHPPKKKKLKCA